MPLRRLTWLRSTTWSAKWRVESQKGKTAGKHAADATEDWSAENRDAGLPDRRNGRAHPRRMAGAGGTGVDAAGVRWGQ